MSSYAGLQQISVSIRGGGGAKPSGVAFFRLLGLSMKTCDLLAPSDSAWKWAVATLFSVRLDEMLEAEEPTEAFAHGIAAGFQKAAAVLAKCKLAGLDQWRAQGKEADIFIGGWLANEQFDLQLPASFLEQCARLGLSISICTNDH